MIGHVHDMEVLWDDLVDAFENSNGERVYFLDRETGEVFLVPRTYEDQEFWAEVGKNRDRFLRIPLFDRDQERFMLRQFLRRVQDGTLKYLLEQMFTGRTRAFGKLDEILSFYPEERERFIQIREELTTGRINNWLEENDLIALGQMR